MFSHKKQLSLLSKFIIDITIAKIIQTVDLRPLSVAFNLKLEILVLFISHYLTMLHIFAKLFQNPCMHDNSYGLGKRL
jgi:hypothetical protein